MAKQQFELWGGSLRQEEMVYICDNADIQNAIECDNGYGKNFVEVDSNGEIVKKKSQKHNKKRNRHTAKS